MYNLNHLGFHVVRDFVVPLDLLNCVFSAAVNMHTPPQSPQVVPCDPLYPTVTAFALTCTT